MSSIRDTERAGTQRIDGIRKRQEAEVKTLVNNHQNLKSDLQKAQEADIVEVQHVHKNQLNDETLRKEKILQEMRKHLDDTKKLTDKEMQEIKNQTFEVRAREQQRTSMDRERVNHEHRMHLDDMNDRYNSEVRKINHDGKYQVAKANNDLLKTKSDNEDFHRSRIQKQTAEFTSRYNTDEAKYKKLKYEQDTFQKKERESTNLKHQTEMAKTVETHNADMEKRDEVYRKGIKDQDLFFEKKYAEHLAKNQQDLKSLNDLNTKVVDKLKTDLASQVKGAVIRSDDPFYQFKELRPTMTEHLDHVEIKVEVPDYSKQDLQLTLNKKEINLNFGRRYTDTNKSEDGTVNKVNKIETFTSKLTAKNFLDPKTVKSAYENGVMTYTIKYS